MAKPIDLKNTKRGTVMRSTGSWYKVRMDSGETLDCRIVGKIRLDKLKSTNPVAVGDHVEIDEGGSIVLIEERGNYIPRKSVNLSAQLHILCANVDQALIFFTLDNPVTTLGYVDRLVVTCEAYSVEPIVIFNKVDLLKSDKLKQKLSEYSEIYQNAGYRTTEVDSTNPSEGEKVRALLKDKVSFLAGRSGTGKSTFVNLADPQLNLPTGQLSAWNNRGKHTTTFAEMHELSFGGFVIDAPGFKEMELYGFSKTEIAHFFPEMREYLHHCKFNNCQHTGEPGCAVISAIEKGIIPEVRFHTYLSMLDEGK